MSVRQELMEGPIGRAYDVNDWIKPAGVATSKTGFTLIPDDKLLILVLM